MDKKDMSGVLFKNFKKTEPTHSDYQGDITIGGVTYWLNAWLKTYMKEGKEQKYMSLSVKAKEAPRPKPPVEEDRAFTDDTLPF